MRRECCWFVLTAPPTSALSLSNKAACVFGASFIFVDIFIRLRPKWKNFDLQDSDKFLAACFSLSFGVMVSGAIVSAGSTNTIAVAILLSRHVAVCHFGTEEGKD